MPPDFKQPAQNRVTSGMFVWQKNVPPGDAEAWRERLAFIGPERLAIVERPGVARPRLEVYLPEEAPALALVSAFGGASREVAAADWQPARVDGPALSIAGRLAITGSVERLAELRASGPALCVPAAMAFGTGEHATTAMCLRLLAEAARRRRGQPWEMLDLGAGTGILALAGRLLGARGALGFDNDPHAVRTARENAKLNGVTRVHFRRLDLIRRWQPEGAWPVIVANLFSGLILELLPRMISALSAEGSLILSGILRTQAPEVEAALVCHRLRYTLRRKGKWTAFLVTRKDPLQVYRLDGM